MSKLEALLFDVDGTLADTERDGHRVAFNLAFAEAGLDWDWSEALYGRLLEITGGKERMLHYLDKYNTAFKRPDYLPDFIAGLHQSKTRHYEKLLSTGSIPLRHGVARLLNEARREKLVLGIATTTTPANVEALITHTLGKEALKWFDVIGAGDIVPNKKPAADIYFYAMRELALSAAHCVAFEDSHNGICATRDAQLTTIITINEYTKDHDFSGAALVLDDMGEPDRPFNVLSGSSYGHTYLELELVRKIHQSV